MLTIVAMAVLGVDIGRLAFTANETQILADTGAAAGALALHRFQTTDPSINPALAARNTILTNSVDGSAAVDENIVSIEYGTFDRVQRTFAPGPGPAGANAVKVVTTATINNIFSAVLPDNDGMSTVFREAIGSAAECPSVGQPVMPITVGDCMFDAFQDSEDCADIPPPIILAPDGSDTACWTSLDDTHTNARDTRDMLPSQCCAHCNDVPGPLVQKGDFINVTNGTLATVLQALRGCLHSGFTDFVIPIVKCDADGTLRCTQSKEVVGFAKLRMTRVQATGGDKGIDLEFLCNSDSSDTTGSGGSCGGILEPTLVM
jgi:hypothetical protein